MKDNHKSDNLKLRIVFYATSLFLALILVAMAFPNTKRLKMAAKPKSCAGLMRVLEGAIEMWEMDHPGQQFGGGSPVVLSDKNGQPTETARSLIPTYCRHMPRCDQGGFYIYLPENRRCWCSRHEYGGRPINE